MWKTTEIFVGLLYIKLHMSCAASLYSSVLWQWSLNLPYFLSLVCLSSTFSLQIQQNFVFSYDSCCSLVNNFIFLIKYLNCAFYFQNISMQSLPLYTSIYIHWKIRWNMLTYFCCGLIFRIIFTSISLFNETFKICKNNKWWLIRFMVLIKF